MAECWQCNWWNFTENRFRLWTSRYSWSKSIIPASKRSGRFSRCSYTSGRTGLTFFLDFSYLSGKKKRSTLTEFDDVSSLCVSVWSSKNKRMGGGGLLEQQQVPRELDGQTQGRYYCGICSVKPDLAARRPCVKNPADQLCVCVTSLWPFAKEGVNSL